MAQAMGLQGWPKKGVFAGAEIRFDAPRPTTLPVLMHASKATVRPAAAIVGARDGQRVADWPLGAHLIRCDMYPTVTA